MNEKVLAEASDLLRASAQEPEKVLPWMLAWAACTANGRDAVAEEDAVKLFARRMRAAAQLLSPTCPHCGKHLDEQPDSAFPTQGK